MLRRKVEQTLLTWKNTPNRKPLILKGCRQCGKTYSVLEFAKKNYEHTVYLNFFENPQFVSVFSGSLEVDHITMLLSALMGRAAVFEPGKTLRNRAERLGRSLRRRPRSEPHQLRRQVRDAER